MRVLAVNAGSSSVKAAFFEGGAERARGQVSRLRGEPLLEADGQQVLPRGVTPTEAALRLAERLDASDVDVVAHRVVHGGERERPVVLTDDALDALADLSPFAPLHQPASLSIARSLRDAMPRARHVACFDTAFHATIPAARQVFPVPARLRPPGVRRYGFHGLAFEGVAHRLAAERPDLTRVVLAHLGSGASLCALRDGRSVATTMSLTPLDGLLMGTRTGGIDPGYVLYLLRSGLAADEVEEAFYKESGLLGLSGISNDVRDLRASPASEARAALEAFAESVACGVAGLVPLLGGLDAVVFSGGIGENDAVMREAITGRLAPLGGFEALTRRADEEAVMAAQASALLAASP